MMVMTTKSSMSVNPKCDIFCVFRNPPLMDVCDKEPVPFQDSLDRAVPREEAILTVLGVIFLFRYSMLEV